MRNLRAFLIFKDYGHGLVLAVCNLCESEAAVLCCIDHHIAKTSCESSLSLRIGELIRNAVELGIVIYLIVYLRRLDRSAIFVHNGHIDNRRFRSIMFNDIDLSVVWSLTDNLLRSVVSSEHIGMHQHSPAGWSIEPAEIEYRLRLACTEEVPLAVNPCLNPCVVTVCVGPSRSIYLAGRDSDRTECRYEESRLLAAAAVCGLDSRKRGACATV